ncbi:MAG: hypothetical protein HGB18_04390 [Candidatus Moranbacteria bacterium]|nr:hypothetical protein [Candidatus Moranbacteria bacterium]
MKTDSFPEYPSPLEVSNILNGYPYLPEQESPEEVSAIRRHLTVLLTVAFLARLRENRWDAWISVGELREASINLALIDPCPMISVVIKQQLEYHIFPELEVMADEGLLRKIDSEHPDRTVYETGEPLASYCEFMTSVLLVSSEQTEKAAS